MQQSKKHTSAIFWIYNIFNAFLLYIVFRGALVIDGDGPGGFGELLIQMFMLQLSAFLFTIGFVAIRNKVSHSIKLNISVAIVAAMALMLISGIMVIEVCSNNYGYCRNWTIHFR